MYVWSSAVLQRAFQTHLHEMYELTKKLDTLKGQKFHDGLKSIYEQAQAISVDYAISEKASNLVLIPGDFGWDDVGDWKVVYDLEKKDLAGNVVIGDDPTRKILTIASQNNLIHADGKLVALLGIDDMIVINTDEILMILPKSKSQDVKKLVERLKEENKEEYL